MKDIHHLHNIDNEYKLDKEINLSLRKKTRHLTDWNPLSCKELFRPLGGGLNTTSGVPSACLEPPDSIRLC